MTENPESTPSSESKEENDELPQWLTQLLKTWRIGTVLNMPLQIHWSLPVLISLVVGCNIYKNGWPSGGAALITIPTAFFIVTIHELGHCLAAQLFKWKTLSITLTGIGGIANIENPKPCPKEELIVAAAGPCVNLLILLTFLSTFGLPTLADGQAFTKNPFQSWEGIYTQAFIVNAFLFTFNMLPIFPMDGGRILKSLAEIFIGQRAGAFLALTGCLAIGIPTAVFLAQKQAFMGSSVIAMMSFIGILNNYSVFKSTKKDEPRI